MSETLEIPDQFETGDVRGQRIAKVYAESLYEAAGKAGQLKEVLGEVEAIVQEVLARDARFDALVTSGALGRDVRADLVERAFKDKVSEILYAFLQVVNSHDRLDLLRPIALALRELYEERSRNIRVHVTSAVPLNEDELARIGEVVKNALKLDPIMAPVVDPTILGGVKIRVGDRQYDATVKTRIENIRNQILTSSSHEIQSRRDRFSSANGDRAIQG